MTISRRRFLQSTAALTVPMMTHGEETPLVLPARRMTNGPEHHWFGYYDKCPWDKTGRYLLAMQSAFVDRQPNAGEEIILGIVDTNSTGFSSIDSTKLWSWQQGTMLQWLNDDEGRSIIYNRTVGQDHQPAAVIFHLDKGRTKTLPMPIYAVNTQGTAAVTLDFSRLHRLRPGYGYASIPEKHAKEPAPDRIGIWHMDLATAKTSLIVTLAQLAANQPKPEFKGAEHWVNHLQFNPGGTRVVFLHRWKQPADKGFRTRMYTVKPDGTDLKILHDSGQISHFDWRDDETILAWVKLKANEPKLAFALLHFDGRPPEVVFEKEKQDGHCSYSPDRKWVLNDTYPDKDRYQHLMLLNVATQRRFNINRFHSPPQYTGPVRCDLHPRWNRDGTQICFDGCHDKQRQIYVVDVKDIVKS